MKTRIASHSLYGKPEVLTFSEEVLPPLQPKQALVQVLMAPIHPADLNMMEGKYFSQPPLPSVLGKEGVGKVLDIGSEVRHLNIGDHVIAPFESNRWVGWWREQGIFEAKDLMSIPSDIPLDQAAMLSINPLTAWLLLRYNGDLPQGSWIAQNAANSAVGQSVIQLATILGYHTLNVVRRPELIEALKTIGATQVFLEEPGLAKALQKQEKIPNISLGFNAVGGSSALEIANLLEPSGTLVTYGAMSKQPLSLPNALLIYKDLRFVGLIRARWCQEAGPATVSSFMTRLIAWVRDQKLTLPVDQIFPFDKVQEALKNASQDHRHGKTLLRMT